MDRYQVIAVLFFLVIALALESCGTLVPESEAVNALQTQGYADVKITHKGIYFMRLRGCGTGDAAKFDATATNARGQKVNVYVCVGWPFKGATVRSN